MSTTLDMGQVIKAVYDEASNSLRVSGGGGGGAVDSVNGQTGTVVLTSTDIPYDNSTSGLSATDAQSAIDELSALLDTASHTLYVDNNRFDTYTETGTVISPYKSIQSAIDSLGVGGFAVIKVLPGTYNENLTITNPYNLALIGDSVDTTSVVVINGNINFTSQQFVKIKNVKVIGDITVDGIDGSFYAESLDLTGDITFDNASKWSVITASSINGNVISNPIAPFALYIKEENSTNCNVNVNNSNTTLYVQNCFNMGKIYHSDGNVYIDGINRVEEINSVANTGFIQLRNINFYNISNNTYSPLSKSGSCPYHLSNCIRDVSVILSGTSQGVPSSLDLGYDNSGSGLDSENVQDAIDELASQGGVLVGPLTALDNQPTEQDLVILGLSNDIKFACLSLSVERDNAMFMGNAYITNKNSNPTITVEGGGNIPTGIVFDIKIDSGNLILTYTSTNTGNDASVKYVMKKWL